MRVAEKKLLRQSFRHYTKSGMMDSEGAIVADRARPGHEPPIVLGLSIVINQPTDDRTL